MKRMLLVAALALISVAGYAKEETKYCELAVYQPGLRRFVGEVNYGGTHKRKFTKIKADNGKVMHFESKLDVLGYITKDGWELVSSYRLPHSDETRFILRK